METVTQSPESDAAALGEAFREAMSQLATGVVMVTTRVDGKPWGLTVSACCSVSIEPPMLLVSLANGTVSARSIDEGRSFGVSILGEGLIDVARFGSAKGAAKFLEAFCVSDDDRGGTSETPVVSGTLAHVDCSLVQAVPAGDHTIYIGRVEHVLLDTTDTPLVYHSRDFHRLEAEPARLLVEGVDPLVYPPW